MLLDSAHSKIVTARSRQFPVANCRYAAAGDGFVTLSAGEVHIWRARLDSDRWLTADRLPGEERDRAAALHPGARQRWVAARWALREVLGRYLGQEPAAIELQVGVHGKPMLAGDPECLRFNLSHSRDLALIAIAGRQEVGVDVEWIDPLRDVLALARRALDPSEARRVTESPLQEKPTAFHAAWTRREAVAKCLGVGLGVPLPESGVAVLAIAVDPGFTAAVAVPGGEVPPLRRFAIEPG
jgi:4'-phosphopantetheinyl transferase